MFERLIYLICLAVDLAMIIMALFVLVESIKQKDFGETICWLTILLALILLTFSRLYFLPPLILCSVGLFVIIQEDEYMWLDICRRYDIVVEWCNK